MLKYDYFAVFQVKYLEPNGTVSSFNPESLQERGAKMGTKIPSFLFADFVTNCNINLVRNILVLWFYCKSLIL